VGWIILGLIAVVIAGVVIMVVRQRRSYGARSAAQDAFTAGAEARSRARSYDPGTG
jgi:hypothetical protein